MRIAAFPKAYLQQMAVDRTMTVFEWIEQARALPVEGLELYSGFFADTSDAAVDRVGEALVGAGFDMPMLCASPDFTHPDADVRAREFDAEVRMIEITRRLAGPGGACRVLTGQAHPGVGIEQGLDWAADAIERLIPIAAAHDVILAIENHYKDGFWTYPEFAQRPEVFLQLLDRIDERVWFGVQYDPSNALVAGADSAEFLTRVVDRVVTMQASDRYLANGASLDDLRTADGTLGYSPDLRHGVIGQGLNDYDRIFAILVAAGYDGWISIEDGMNGLDEMRASAEFLQRARDRWFGGSTTVSVRTREAAVAGQQC
jgi:sugar phosphate isomerase/epimerase